MTLINPTRKQLRAAFREIAAAMDPHPKARWNKIMQEKPIKEGKLV